MGKLVVVKKEQLKISAEEHEKKLKEDPISAKILKAQNRQVEQTLKRLKEGQ